ncbi:tenomodulin-like [Poecilia latipinna]|uniref:tenomodulin-like n=1 Tax=Poecilia latipinna TaxID=48699 RepID=UPI00072E816F|nr:PREDICTED: tenomodulin-like [Poecilia latipinna]
MRVFWSFISLQVYDHEYKAVVDGVETNSVMEIDPADLTEIFRMGNGSKEVVEVHDFKNGITGIRFAEHQRCYIRTQTKKLPTVAEAEADDRERTILIAQAAPYVCAISVFFCVPESLIGSIRSSRVKHERTAK